MEFSPTHLSLHYDGLRIDRGTVKAAGSTDLMCQKSVSAILASTGYHVTIVEKQHLYFVDLLRSRDPEERSGTQAPPHLLQNGNCIPLAIARVQDSIAHIAEAVKQAPEARTRTYRDCQAICQVTQRLLLLVY